MRFPGSRGCVRRGVIALFLSSATAACIPNPDGAIPPGVVGATDETIGVPPKDAATALPKAPPGAFMRAKRMSLQAAPESAGGGPVHVVEPGQTLHAVGRLYKISPSRIASANQLSAEERLRTGQRLVIPGGEAPPPAIEEPAPQPAPEKKEEPKIVQDSPNPNSQNDARPEEAIPEPGRASRTSFRWPVRGRVISRFGETSAGQRNDGINLAVPEGTPIKAAENGVVAYVGDEVKQYGNLVLVRHEGDFITAYAHSSEIAVKKGETVRRGQIIAKAGRTGSVDAPQVHFEIRKAQKPVDPMGHLSEP